MVDDTIYRTSYFRQPFTWIKRGGIFLFFVVLLAAWEMGETPWDFWWIKYAIFVFLSLGLFFSPIDDIMIDEKYFYHLRTSLWSARNRVSRYEIASIQTIRCRGVHEEGLTMSEFVGGRNQLSTETNTIEMSFKDGSYKSLEVAIYKQELILYVSKIRERMTI